MVQMLATVIGSILVPVAQAVAAPIAAIGSAAGGSFQLTAAKAATGVSDAAIEAAFKTAESGLTAPTTLQRAGAYLSTPSGLLTAGMAIQGAATVASTISETKALKFAEKTAEAEAGMKRATAAEEAKRIGEEGRRLRGRQTALQASRGIKLETIGGEILPLSGSPYLIAADTSRRINEAMSDALQQGEFGAIVSEFKAKSARKEFGPAIGKGFLGAGELLSSYGIYQSQRRMRS